MNFADLLLDRIIARQNPVCVGIDPRLKNLPSPLRDSVDDTDAISMADAFECFSREIIDVVAPLVPIVKPQSAFFEALGWPGVRALAKVVEYAKERDLLVLLDAKRGDIGSTAEAYATAYLADSGAGMSADALTVNPYMGVDTLVPFVDACRDTGRGIFVLVKTSNPGSGHFQDRLVQTETVTPTVFELVADEVEKLSIETKGEKGYGAVGAVVGATYPEQLAQLRQRMPHTLFLIPGFGAQGGGVADVLPGFDRQGLGAIVNSSRGIIFAYERPEYQSIVDGGGSWQKAVEMACRNMTEQLGVPALKNRPGM